MAEGGTFAGLASVQLLEDGRKLRLLEDFKFKDCDSLDWLTPKNWIVDGASIPQVLWTLTGGPLEGKFRDASIIHDYYCDKHLRGWRETHRVFYNGMIARGVDGLRAKAMYYAVFKFGPRWKIIETPSVGLTGGRPKKKLVKLQATLKGDKAEVERAKSHLTAATSLEDIERLAESGELETK